MTIAAPLKARWSSTRVCPLKARFEVIGAEARPTTGTEQWIFSRGHALENAYAEWLDAAGVEYEREKKVRWPGGVGHIDFYIPEGRLAVECLSTDTESNDMVEGKLLQLAGYLHYSEDCGDEGWLVLLRSSAPPEVTPFKLTDEWRERVEARTADLLAAMRGEQVERVCSKPGDARSHFCPFASVCFEGWVPTPLDANDSPEFRTLAVRRYELQRQREMLNASLAPLDAEVKTIDKQLAELMEPGDLETGPLKVHRTHVGPRRSLDLKKAELAGWWSDAHDEHFAPFIKWVGEHNRFKVERVSDAPLLDADSFGPHPFDEVAA